MATDFRNTSVMLALYFLPTPSIQGFPVPPIEQRASPCDGLNKDRTIWGIIWSCLATILAATWVSTHPNIPEPQSASEPNIPVTTEIQLKRWFRAASPRLQIMVIGLIAPELVIVWAYRQHIMASKLANDHQWTMSHGFFAIMGGFMLYEGKNPQRTLSTRDLEDYFNEIDILEEEIQDKSKGDFLSKAIAIGQTGWFVLQCLARWAEHLPLTDLELVTLAFASLNFVIYAIWWSKPIDVQQPYRISGGKVEPDANRDSVQLQGTVRWWAIWHATWHTIWRAACNPVLRKEETLSDVISAFMKESGLDRDMGWKDLGNAKKVPIWYAGERGEEEGKAVLRQAILVGVVVATIFGAIHCIGWSFEFPSRTELLLWRLSSLAITCIPPFVFVICHFGSDEPNCLWRLLGAIAILCVGLYFLCRVAILVLAFSTLRSLSQKAYQDVHWVHFISPT